MKVARLYSYDDIRIEDMPRPVPGPREALIKTRASGICSGDTMRWYIEKKAPLVLGHEPSGEIVEVGPEVSSFKPGQGVFVHHHAPCFVCPRCQRGDYVQCDTWRGSRIVPGGVSEYILVPEVNLEYDTIAIPDGVGFEDAALVEPLGCVVKGLKRARLMRGDTALVVGLGFMGMLNVLMLRKYGASRVIGADMVRFRLDKASALGAHAVMDLSGGADMADELRALTNGAMANVVVVCPASAQAMLAGLKCVAPGGTLLMFSPATPGTLLTLDPNEIYFKDISLVPSYSCGPTDTADAMDAIRAGVVRAADLVTHRFPIEQAAEAFRLTASAGDSLKCMVVFD